LQLAYYSPFCPKFRSHCNEGQSGKNSIGSIRWPIPENRPTGAKISQKSLTQGELSPILSQILLPRQRGSVAEKCNWQHSMAHSRKPPYRRKNLLRKPSYSPFCPKFRCYGNHGRSEVKLNNTIRFAIPENHTLEPKITTLSYTQSKL